MALRRDRDSSRISRHRVVDFRRHFGFICTGEFRLMPLPCHGISQQMLPFGTGHYLILMK